MLATWNIWLINRDQPPLLYFKNLTEEQVNENLQFSASKVFDGSDADAFVVTRSDYAPAINLVKVQ